MSAATYWFEFGVLAVTVGGGSLVIGYLTGLIKIGVEKEEG